MTGFYDQMHIDDECVLKRTMFVDTTGIKSTDFNLDEDKQETLFESGVEAARAFVKSWSFESYVKDCRR
jgi:NTE family protein